MTINEALRLGRAKNAVLTFLEKRLVVPKIYIDAVWNNQRVDVLAIDRDGVGDVHVILLAPINLPDDSISTLALGECVDPFLERISILPAQYKYVTAVAINPEYGLIPNPPASTSQSTFSPDGIGRVGVLTIDFTLNDEARISVVLKPERFRAKIAKLADEYVQQHEADWEIRA